MKSIRCKSGIMGRQERLRAPYSGLEEFERYCEVYGLHARLGYKTPASAWRHNPMVEGSVIPSDFRKSRKTR